MNTPLQIKTDAPDYNALTQQIRLWAEELALTVGFTSPTIAAHHRQRLSAWLAAGYHGDMDFFERNQAARTDPRQLQENTLCIISARLNYWDEQSSNAQSILTNPNIGYISRYALGRDYHKVLRQKLKQLCLNIEAEIGSFIWRPFTDSAPIMEHALAEQAGLGFIGKNTLLIHPQAGSTFFLGEVICNLPLASDPATEKCGCGPCNNCLTDCPTGAIVAPFTVDARRCISYLTIEHEGSIDESLRPLMGNRIYGCDDCQLTCPWNKFSQTTITADFSTRHQLDQQPLLTLWHWSEQDFLSKTEGSPIRRIGYEKWRRNLAIALGNAPSSTEVLQGLENAILNASDLVKEHILWALAQHKNKTNQQAVHVRRYFL
jgi:epoxyqueuosine reductase